MASKFNKIKATVRESNPKPKSRVFRRRSPYPAQQSRRSIKRRNGRHRMESFPLFFFSVKKFLLNPLRSPSKKNLDPKKRSAKIVTYLLSRHSSTVRSSSLAFTDEWRTCWIRRAMRKKRRRRRPAMFGEGGCKGPPSHQFLGPVRPYRSIKYHPVAGYLESAHSWRRAIQRIMLILPTQVTRNGPMTSPNNFKAAISLKSFRRNPTRDVISRLGPDSVGIFGINVRIDSVGGGVGWRGLGLLPSSTSSYAPAGFSSSKGGTRGSLGGRRSLLFHSPPDALLAEPPQSRSPGGFSPYLFIYEKSFDNLKPILLTFNETSFGLLVDLYMMKPLSDLTLSKFGGLLFAYDLSESLSCDGWLVNWETKIWFLNCENVKEKNLCNQEVYLVKNLNLKPLYDNHEQNLQVLGASRAIVTNVVFNPMNGVFVLNIKIHVLWGFCWPLAWTSSNCDSFMNIMFVVWIKVNGNVSYRKRKTCSIFFKPIWTSVDELFIVVFSHVDQVKLKLQERSREEKVTHDVRIEIFVEMCRTTCFEAKATGNHTTPYSATKTETHPEHQNAETDEIDMKDYMLELSGLKPNLQMIKVTILYGTMFGNQIDFVQIVKKLKLDWDWLNGEIRIQPKGHKIGWFMN